jgi:type IV pilus assembly protein PilF
MAMLPERSMVLTLVAGVLAAGCIGPASDIPDPKSQAVADVASDEFKKGHLREALAKVNEALELDRGNHEAALLGAHIYLAFCARDASSSDCRFDDAERLARLAVDKAPDYREAKNSLGVILVHQKKYEDAIAVLKPLSEDILYSSPQMAWGNLGWAYLESEQLDLAIDALRRSVAAQAAFCVGNHRLGLAYERKGDLQAAKAAFTRALETERPECQRIQEAWEGRARVSERLGLIEDARRDSKQCAKMSSGSPSGARCGSLLASLPVASAPAESTEAGPPAEGS